MLTKSKQVEKIIHIGNIQIEKRSLWYGLYGFFIIGITEKISQADKKRIKNRAKKEKVLFIQIEYINYNISKLNNKSEYYKKFITPYTAVICLKQSEEEILSNMKPKWRYNIRLAEKKWIIVKEVEKNEKNISLFHELMCETTSRDNFSGNTILYYQTFLENLKQSQLLFAKKDDTLIAAWIFTFDTEVSYYYYWASTSNKEYRNCMAPYILQWKALQIAQEKKSKIYDFLGVSSPDDINSSLAWVTSFKKKFTKNIQKVSYSELIIERNILYFFFSLIRKIFKK